MNPYEPPGSPVETSNGGPNNSIWWKVFFWITLFLFLISIFGLAFMQGLTLMDYADFALSIIALVGLFGFAYYKRIGSVVFWRYFFYVSLIEAMVFTLVFPLLGIPRYGTAGISTSYYFEIAYGLIILWVLYRYAYRSPHVWEPAID